MKPGLVDIVEASYNFKGSDENWMRSVGEVVSAHLGYGLGAIAIRYRIAANDVFQPLAMSPIGIATESVEFLYRAHASLPPDYVAKTFGSTPCDIASNTGPDDVRVKTEGYFRDYFEPMGWKDSLNINGLDPTRQGLVLAVWLPKRMTMTPLLRTRWSRVAAHLAAANRLRNRIHQPDDLAPETAEAILTPAGLIEHAHPGAQSSDARSRLAAGVRTVDRARGALRRTDPDLAVSEWKALIAARWTLVDHFESDGKRYVLARRNEAVESKGAPLTAREEQALGFASLGHTNKLIAYEMGISASTVSVLLYRAAKKFKTNSRAALIAAYLGESSAVIRKSHR